MDADWLAERALLENLAAYATAVPSKRIPFFMLDPMLGVQVAEPGVHADAAADEGESEVCAAPYAHADAMPHTGRDCEA